MSTAVDYVNDVLDEDRQIARFANTEYTQILEELQTFHGDHSANHVTADNALCGILLQLSEYYNEPTLREIVTVYRNLTKWYE